MKFCRFFLIGIAAAIALFLCGCEEMPSQSQQAVAALPIPMPTPSGWWNDDSAPGASRIVVHLTEQKAYFYKGKILVGESTVSTGTARFLHASRSLFRQFQRPGPLFERVWRLHR